MGFVAFPAIAFCLLWRVVTANRRQLGLSRLSWRGTAVVTFVVFEVLLVLVTELLSAGHRLTHGYALVAWLAVAMAATAMLLLSASRDLGGGPAPLLATVHRARRQSVDVVAGVCALAAIVVALGVTGWLYLPSNGDSLVYHLARVAHWEQEASVSHFATHYTAQIELAPLHEFNMLHVHLLTGSDRLDGYVQLAAFMVCSLGAAEIARLLGAAGHVQVGAALLFAVLPSAVLEGTSTQNNVFATACAIALVVLLLAWPPRQRTLVVPIVVGLGIGLAVLAKGTLPPLLAPVMLIIAGLHVDAERRSTSWPTALRRAAASVVVIAAGTALVAGPFLKRNHDLFGTFTGPVSRSTLNYGYSVRGSVGNVIRSVAINFRVGGGRAGPDTAVQHLGLGGLERIYDWVQATADDTGFFLGSVYDPFGRDDYRTWARLEEYGANPWHVLLIVATGVILIVGVGRGDRTLRFPAALAAGLAAGFVVFAATTRWSVYVARYHIPLYAVWAALTAIVLARLHRAALWVVVALLVLAVTPQLFDNAARSLLHRDSDSASGLAPYFYYGDESDIFVGPSDYVAARDAIVNSGCDRLGIANWVLLEYPIWVGLDVAGWRGRIEHVDVSNASAALQDDEFAPCALIRQRLGRAALAPPAGWTDVPFGNLAVAFAPESRPS